MSREAVADTGVVRGEAANHGILDVKRWLNQVLPALGSEDAEGLQSACNTYEAEMISRTHPAVLLSRRACLDAHDHKRINEHSPLVSKRAAVPTEAETRI